MLIMEKVKEVEKVEKKEKIVVIFKKKDFLEKKIIKMLL